jgi:uroporphyrinogen III methyltransferase/synthase
MRDVEAASRIALVGCAAGAAGLLTPRARWWLGAADAVFARAGAPQRAQDTELAPQDPRACADALVRRAADGGCAVLAFQGDPLRDAYGAAVAFHLTSRAIDWEYVPGVEVSESVPGAIAHLSRAAVAPTDVEWEAWRARHPLLGATIAVTRAPRQAADLVAALSARGADALSCPTIEIADPADFSPLDAALGALGRYQWVIFTSANGVQRFFDRLAAKGGDVRQLAGARLAAIGAATSAALAARGLRADVVPERAVAESLFSALEAAGPLGGSRVLLARAAVGRDVLPDALRRAGAEVDVVEVYRTVPDAASRDALVALVDAGRLDLVTFTSPSTVANFVGLVGGERATRPAAAVSGPITSEAAREAGLRVAFELPEYDVDALVAAAERWFRGLRR